MKKLSIIIIAFIWLFSFSAFAQEQVHNAALCENRIYDIKGLSDIKKDQISEYSLIRWQDKYFGPINFKSVKFTLSKNKKTIAKSSSDLISFTPTELWTYNLQVEAIDNENCYSNINKTINVHEKIVLYLWKQTDDLQAWFDENFQKHNTLFKKVIMLLLAQKKLDYNYSTKFFL